MTISEHGLSLIKKFEGFKATAYLCPAPEFNTANLIKWPIYAVQELAGMVKSILGGARHHLGS